MRKVTVIWRGHKEAEEEDMLGQGLGQPGQDPTGAGSRQEEGVIEGVDISREAEGQGGKESIILTTQLQRYSNKEAAGRKSETLSQRKKNISKILWRH